MNWTLDSWTRQENVIAIVDDAGVARAFRRTSRSSGAPARSTAPATSIAPRGDIRPWFCPGRGEDLSHRIARVIGQRAHGACASRRP